MHILGRGAEGCLTPAQVEAAKKIYGPARESENETSALPGHAARQRTSGGRWPAGASRFGSPVNFHGHFVFNNAEWDLRRMDFDKDVAARDVEVRTRVFSAIDPVYGILCAWRQADHVSRLERSADLAVQHHRLLHQRVDEMGRTKPTTSRGCLWRQG